MDFAQIIVGVFFGLAGYVLARALVTGFFTVDQNERAVLTSFGRAERIGTATTLDDPIAEGMPESDRGRYIYPQVKVIGPGGPYFKWPWQEVFKISTAIETVNIAFDPENAQVNQNNTVLEAVTKDQLNTGITGQLRFKISERNLYAYLFGIKNPIAHVMGYFISVLRERISVFQAPKPAADQPDSMTTVAGADGIKLEGISINDLRKNLNEINLGMDEQCQTSAARYGIVLDASLITGIDPPIQIESALAAINTAHNEVSSDISLAQAFSDQRIVESKRAVEIQTMKAEAEVQPLRWLSEQLKQLKASGPDAIPGYLRNVRLGLYSRSRRIILDMKK